MADKLLDSAAVSAYCGSIATMLSAGIQTEEAALLLAENRTGSRFAEVCNAVYESIVKGKSLSESMRSSEGFPEYACDMIKTGESSGHIDEVLRNLELYYAEEDRIFAKLKSSVGYPLILLAVMAAILLFTVLLILPIFTDVYHNLVGSLATVSVTSIETATTIAWVALGITVALMLICAYLWVQTGSEDGRARVMKLFEHISVTKDALYQLALSRFSAALATFLSAGLTSEDALENARATVDHDELSAKLEQAYESMVNLDNPRSLPQALDEFSVFEPLYARMLNVGTRSGKTDETLAQFSQVFFDDAVLQIDRSLDRIEPMLAAFLTLAVGLTLISVMLPLIGIMSSIG